MHSRDKSFAQGNEGGERDGLCSGGGEIGKACGERCDCGKHPDISRCPGTVGLRATAEPPSRGT